MDIEVLRIGQRVVRDDRVTTHVALVARSFGAQKIYMNEVNPEIKRTISGINKTWGGNFKIEIISENLREANTGAVFGMVFIIVGLAFKVSAVPFHMWTPDVYEGSPTSVTSFFALVPKIAALTVFIRFMYVPFINVISHWQTIIIFLSIASMILGAVAAIGQSNIKRLMAYSSIGHMGYALAGLAPGTNAGIHSTIIYLTIYLIMNLGAFGCIFMMKRSL